MAKEIPLTQGKVAIVDDEDYERINAHKWRYAHGYAVRQEHHGFKETRMHRAVLNAPEGATVDHKNGDKLDNRRENIRLCTTWQNTMNRGRQKNNRSGFKGVSRHKKKWIASIKVGPTIYYFGGFETPIAAARAYDAAARKYFGEFARLNFPDDA